jgi:hypothetical protein
LAFFRFDPLPAAQQMLAEGALDSHYGVIGSMGDRFYCRA